MEYYGYQEMSSKNATASIDSDQVIVIAVASSAIGIMLFICFCCLCTTYFSSWIDNIVNTSLSNSDSTYGDLALRRMEETEERKKENPEVRKEKILKSFERNNVCLVRMIECMH